MSARNETGFPEAVPPPICGEWRVVTSRKPQRQGEFFLLRENVFVLKLYKGVRPPGFAEWLARQLEKAEYRQRRTHELREYLPDVTPVEALQQLRKLIDGTDLEHVWLNSPNTPSYGPLDLIDAALANAEKRA